MGVFLDVFTHGIFAVLVEFLRSRLKKLEPEGVPERIPERHNQFWKEDWFAGGFAWKWFHKHSEVGGGNNNRFTPQNKPGEETLRKLYKQ